MNREYDFSRKIEVAANKNVKERDYWIEKLSGELVKSHFSYDHNDHKGNSGIGYLNGKVAYEIPPDIYVELNKLSGGSLSKLHMILTAGLVLLLHKYTGNNDIIIGTPIYKQEIEGEFVNTALALRNTVADSMTFKELLLSVRQTLLDAIENQNYPIQSLVVQLKLPLKENEFPLFDTVILLENIQDKHYIQHVQPGMYFIFAEVPGSIFGTIEYHPGYYEYATAEQAANHYISLLGQALSDVNRCFCDLEILSEAEKHKLVKELDHMDASWPCEKTITQLFEEQVEKFPGKTAVVFANEKFTYRELDEKANRIANYLYMEKQIRADHRVGLLMEKSNGCIAAILGILIAGGGYVPIDPGLPEERVVEIIDDGDIEVLISEKKYIKSLNRLQWQCSSLHTFLCLDSRLIDDEEEKESALMDRKLWEYVGESALDDITGGGWKSSYTGRAISNEEMAEYGRNALEKVIPFLHPKARVLEIGCATGLTMYLIAPKVSFYYGTDLSPVIIERNRERVQREGYTNIKLECLPAHEIDKIEEKNFDLIIMNSVIQHFSGHNYLRKVIVQTIQLLAPKGVIFIGDIMELERKEALINELRDFKKTHTDQNYRTKTDWSEELFISKSFFRDLEAEIPVMRSVEFSDKIRTIENELTKFRYDALINIDKDRAFGDNEKKKLKYRDDLRALEKHSCRKPGIRVHPHQLLYIIYTSGTTGKPKGVMIEHRNLVRLFVNDCDLFDFNNSDVWTMFHSYNFDFSVWEMYGALLHGGKLVVIPRETARDTREFLRILDEHQVTVLNQTPAAFYRLMEEEEASGRTGGELSLRYLIFGGEALIPAKLKRWQQKYPHIKIINMYGITETTVHVTFKNIGSAEIENNSRGIGAPIPTLCAVVLDRNCQLLPMGAAGELYVGGVGVARGYLNRPELTAEKFNRFYKANRDYIFYRTGDLTRALAGGELEYLGRIDQQVKIRGFRIELGEVESHIRRHEAIKDAAVIMRDDGYGDRYLCAYVVQESNDNNSELKDYLAKKLPEYMIPLHFVSVEKIPLTPNGKLDQKALPEPASTDADNDYISPGDEIEMKLTEIWADILHIDKGKISMTANFFDLGGHSLKATILVANISKLFNVKVPLVEVFRIPIIRELAAYIKGVKQDIHKSIEPVEEREYYVLSSAQKRIYFLQQFDQTGIGYNMPMILPLGKGILKDKLESVLLQLINRHESLRTSFERVNEEVVQKTHKTGTIEFSLDYYEAAETGLEKIIKDYIKPFDLSQAPLIRSGLIKLPDDNCIWIVDVHHIVSDGTSHTILTEDFMAAYNGKELKPLHIQYKDFVLWQQRRFESGEIKAQLEYWLDMFAGEILPLNLPLDKKRPPAFTFEGNSYRLKLLGEEAKKFKGLGSQGGGTLYMNMMAALNVLFYKYTGQSDIIIGSGIAGRKHADLQSVVGMFINTLAMRNYPKGEIAYENFLKEVISGSIRGFENQDVQFEDLVDNLNLERDASRNPVFDIMMMVQNFRQVGEAGRDSKVEYDDMSTLDVLPAADKNPAAGKYKNNTSKFDMTFFVHEQGDDIFIKIEYYTAIFKTETIQRFASHLKNIIKAVVTNSTIKLKDIEIISDDEKKKVIYEFNDTERNYPGEKTIHQLFEEQASKTPDHIALVGADLCVCPDRTVNLTYGQLNKQSNLLAGLLIGKGVQADNIIGIMARRSIEMVIGIMGILMAGGAYLPIDPELPQDRIDYMLKDSNALFLINEKFFGGFRGAVLQKSPPASANLAYIIYTSGSTGKPKGVLVEHKSVVNILSALHGLYPLMESDAYLLKTSYSFDVSVTELFGWFLGGGRLAILEKGSEKDPKKILDAIEYHRVTHINFAPSMFNAFLEELSTHDSTKLTSQKYIFLAGEAILPGLVEKFKNFNLKISLENIYGPTEATIYSSWYPLSSWEEKDIVPIGKPLPNITLYILDQFNALQPPGVVGELCVGGEGIARGYLNRPELTAEKFNQANKNKSVSGGAEPRGAGGLLEFFKKAPLLYRTGDLARWKADGNIEYLGRIDHQVKIRGFRIELGEIENRLLDHPLVKEAVVVVQEGEDGDKSLTAYLVSREAISPSQLREYLLAKLPEYMIPSYFILLESIPLTTSGKLDRKTLPKPGTSASEGFKAARNENEKLLVEIWADLLGRPKEHIGVEDNFFHLGGHSLKAVLLTSKIHKEFNVKIPLTEFFKLQTVSRLATYIKNAKKSKYENIEPVEEREYYNLSSIQKRLYFLQQMELKSIAYNMPLILPLENKEEAVKIEVVLKKLITRHESLRTSFLTINNEPIQKIHKTVEFSIPNYEISAEERLQIYRQFTRPFDLAQAPLLRANLIVINSANSPQSPTFRLFIDIHHIITDGVSQEILREEFSALFADPSLKLEPPRLQYKDYSRWQNSETYRENMKDQEDYWLNEFQGEIPVLDLITDYPRPLLQSFAGASINFLLKCEETALLKENGLKHNVTLFMVLLATFNILLARLSSQDDIVIGTVSAGRRHADLETIVGMFVNTLPMRNYPTGDQTFKEFLGNVKESTLTAFENQEYPFEELVDKLSVKRDTARNPLFDVMFVLQNMNTRSGDRDDETELQTGRPVQTVSQQEYENTFQPAKFDLTLIAEETGDELFMSFQYCTELFKKGTIERFIAYYKQIVFTTVKEPGIKISEIEFLSEEEKNRILYEFNDTEKVYPKDKTIHQLFEEQVKRTPDYIAIVGADLCVCPSVFRHGRTRTNTDNNMITYGQLNELSDRLAGLLIEKGVLANSIVGIMIEPSVDMVIGIMGILKAGGAYLPFDPELPQDRIDYMLKDSNALFLINEKFFVGYRGAVLQKKSPTSANLAYIIYTSGSTGKPKGVMIQHQSLVNLCSWHNRYFQVKESDHATQYAKISFDASVWEIFPYLIRGASLTIINDEIKLDIEKLNTFFETHDITISFLPTQVCEQFMELENHSLRILLTGGDRLGKFAKRDYDLYNNYGPTENTVVNTSFLVSQNHLNIPIGRPVDNNRIYIMDPNGLFPQPAGIPGELYIAGEGLARGYLNNPELTSDKFYRSFWSNRSYILYKTGDLARWLSDSNIEFLGRIDQQVKIRGFRIELGEIESQLMKHPEIKEAVVTTESSENGNKYLCGYISTNRDFQVSELRKYLGGRLPGYMIPSEFVLLEKMPLMSSGKVDRQKLNSLGKKLNTGVEYIAPKSDNEVMIADAWKGVLGLDEVGVNDNFFDLGGTSIDIIRLNSKLKEVYKRDIPIVALYRYTTIASFSQFLDDENTDIENIPSTSRYIERADKMKKGMEDKNKRREIRSRRRE